MSKDHDAISRKAESCMLRSGPAMIETYDQEDGGVSMQARRVPQHGGPIGVGDGRDVVARVVARTEAEAWPLLQTELLEIGEL